MAHHHHDHDHNHSHAPKNFTKAFAIAVIANLGFTLIEAIYALLANSASLLADAGHNLGDVLGLAIAWFASWLMSLQANRKYSYGFKRSTILAAISNAVLLIVASILIVGESIDKLINPAPINEMTVIIVAAIGIFINGGTAMLFMRGQDDDLNIKGAYLHLAYDALISVGVVIAGVIILLTGWYWLDPLVGLAIVVAILFGTWGLFRDSMDLIMDAVPHWIDEKKVRAYLENAAAISAVHHMHIWGLSTQGAAMTAHVITQDGRLNNSQHEKIKHDLLHEFKIEHVTLQVEHTNDQHPCSPETVCTPETKDI